MGGLAGVSLKKRITYMETYKRHCCEDPDSSPVCGTCCYVRSIVGAESSLEEALDGLGFKQQQRVAAKVMASFVHLANGGQLRSPDRWQTEGDLPGQAAGKFYAVKCRQKQLNLRAYLFKFDSDWWVSHYVNKKNQKLSNSDIERVHSNYRYLKGNS